jgi:hypothetical protein
MNEVLAKISSILYSYLMGVDAIDQTICPEVLGISVIKISKFLYLDNNIEKHV